MFSQSITEADKFKKTAAVGRSIFWLERNDGLSYSVAAKWKMRRSAMGRKMPVTYLS
jgi:hypothetical protein